MIISLSLSRFKSALYWRAAPSESIHLADQCRYVSLEECARDSNPLASPETDLQWPVRAHPTWDARRSCLEREPNLLRQTVTIYTEYLLARIWLVCKVNSPGLNSVSRLKLNFNRIPPTDTLIERLRMPLERLWLSIWESQNESASLIKILDRAIEWLR